MIDFDSISKETYDVLAYYIIVYFGYASVAQMDRAAAS